MERKAVEAFEERIYTFTVYFAEQAFQLYVKYMLAKEVGDCPEKHSFLQLFKALSRIIEYAESFYEENTDVFDILEDTYIGV